MNVPLSLLIYNPIEAYTLVLLCDIIIGRKTAFNIKSIPIIYIFGSINFIIQWIPNIFYGSILFVILGLFNGYFIVSFSLMLMYKCLSCDVLYRKCILCQLINTIFIVVISSIMKFMFNIGDLFYNNNNLHEFIVNLLIFSMQIITYNFIRSVFNYEKYSKENRRRIS